MGPGVISEEKDHIMSKFMMSLKISGYDHKFRHTLLKGILAKQLDIDSKVRDGQRSLYRSRDQILAMKAEKLGKHPETWL